MTLGQAYAKLQDMGCCTAGTTVAAPDGAQYRYSGFDFVAAKVWVTRGAESVLVPYMEFFSNWKVVIK